MNKKELLGDAKFLDKLQVPLLEDDVHGAQLLHFRPWEDEVFFQDSA